MTTSNAGADDLFAILIAPNVSEQMGGEAMKALHIWLELQKAGVKAHQITHERVEPELRKKFPENVSFVKETWVQGLLWKSVIGRPVSRWVFQWKAAKMAGQIARQHRNAVVHFSSPVSPVLPMFRVPGVPVVIGPINGNIFYPPKFRRRESWLDFTRRITHPIMQFGHRFFFRGKQSADRILVAGGERTYKSLRMAGCRDEQFVDALDSGILERLGKMPLANQTGKNLRFVHNGRLVDHKGTDLVMKALKKTKLPVELEVIGRGPNLPQLKQLAGELDLGSRIKFTEWIEDHSKVAEILQQFRAFVFPSLAEANGIVVQEAMAIGLPVIALDWGGPALLVTPESGILIKATDEETVTTELAKAMDHLAENGEAAQKMAEEGRRLAITRGFLWPDLIQNWIAVYRQAIQAHAHK